MIHYELVLRKIHTEGGVEGTREEFSATFTEEELNKADYDLLGEAIHTLFEDMLAEEESWT